MRGSSLTTFLMFLPLIAIPLLAVFGVPEFSPVNASPTEPGGRSVTLAGLDANSAAPHFHGKTDPEKDLFPALDPPKRVGAGAQMPPARNPFHDERKLGRWAVQQARKSETLKPKPSSPHKKAVSNKPAAAPLTWRNAVRRLNRLGIRDYLLQPGSTSEHFHFSCQYSSPDNPRVTRRFEAESSDPLSAVKDVLQQLEATTSEGNRG